ncbi:MAG: non-specific endonuclease [Sphingobacterium sp.]|jgi:endonuclease G|nr:non-specific endonuclease [Sphingobacterium sp.]
MKTIKILCAIGITSLLLVGCNKEELPVPSNPVQTDAKPQIRGMASVKGAGDNGNTLLGNPSSATTSTTNYNNYLMETSYYSLSYSRDRGIPNWVSWHIDTDDLGTTPRQDDFRSNTTLPTGWYRVSSSSYSGSGFDRGHYCPSADRTSSITANSATFLMTNMMPQAPNNNQQTWNSLESYTRSLVTSSGKEVYVVCGSYGKGGTGSNGGVTTSIDNGKVTVPNRTWKVIVVLDRGTNDLSRISTSTRVIAVDMPNSNSISSDWRTYRTTVDAIETATGYNLLTAISTATQSTLEARRDIL